MTLTEKQFFSLLRSGLRDGAPDAALFPPETDWEALYRLAFEQTVVGVVTDGIHRLPAACLPTREERLDPFLGDVMFTEARNNKLNAVLPKLLRVLSDLQAVVVKGQPVGQAYPDPLRRQPGDIDLLLPPADYLRAKERLVPKASKVEEESEQILHLGMFFGSIEVELHGTISTLMSPSLDAKLADLQADMFARGVSSCDVAGTAVPVPDERFSAEYIFVHFLHHYWSGGVGLRQIVDWARFLEVHGGRIDRDALRADIEKLGLVRVWHAFLSFATDYCFLPRETAGSLAWKPLPSGWRNARIWRHIRRSGNFGKNVEKPRGAESYWVRKFHSFWQLVFRDRLRHFVIFPLESLRFFAGAFRYGLGRLAKGE